MSGVIFSHPAVSGSLRLLLPPTQVDWTYNLLTSRTPTFAGEVVQILSVNFDRLTVMGRFGLEGAHGHVRSGGKLIRRQDDNWNTTELLGVGLVQMTAWFRAYFSVASQGEGEDVQPDTNYRQEPVTLTYQAASDTPVDIGKSEQVWKIYPVSFPSYRRSLENFAPEWKVECEVFEAPGAIQEHEQIAAVERLKFTDRYQAMNPFSDPIGAYYWSNKANGDSGANQELIAQAALASAEKDTRDLADFYNSLFAEYSSQDIADLINQNASLPSTVAPLPQTEGAKRGQDRLKESRSRRRLVNDALRTFSDEG